MAQSRGSIAIIVLDFIETLEEAKETCLLMIAVSLIRENPRTDIALFLIGL